MSGTNGVSGTLLDSERVDARRFCGYPALSDGTSNSGWRFYNGYGELEYRLSSLTAPELVVLRSFLGNLTVLEAAVPAAGATLDTDQAAVWTRNRDEVSDRQKLLAAWARRMCDFLGVPPGPGLLSGNNLALVV